MVRDPVERAWSHARKDLTLDGRAPREIDPESLSRLLIQDKQRGLALYRTLIANWREHLKEGHLFVGAFDCIASKPRYGFYPRFMSFLRRCHRAHATLGAISMTALTRRLRGEIPPAARELLRDLLEERRAAIIAS